MGVTERIDWVDLSKGLGIIFVVYGHVARGLNSAGMGFELFSQIDNAIYAFHMPLFFILSGFFFIKSVQRGGLNYVKIKMSTILYPYLVWSLIQVIIHFFASNYTNSSSEIEDLFLFFVPRAQFWFLLALFIISVLSAALYCKFGKWGLAVSSAFSLVYIVAKPEIYIVDDTLNNLLFFNIGIFLYTNIPFRKKLIDSNLFSLFNAVLFFILEYLLIIKEVYSSSLGLIIAISGSLLVIQLMNLKFFNFSHIKEIGRRSMIIYILHILVASGSRILLLKIFEIENTFFHICVGTLLGVYVPFLLVQIGIIEKVSFLFKYPSKI